MRIQSQVFPLGAVRCPSPCLRGSRWGICPTLQLPSGPSDHEARGSREPRPEGSGWDAEPSLLPQFHAEPAGQRCPRSGDTQGFLHRQNSGLGLTLGTKEADLGPFPLLPAAILRGGSKPGTPVREAGGGAAGAHWGERPHQGSQPARSVPGTACPGAQE